LVRPLLKEWTRDDENFVWQKKPWAPISVPKPKAGDEAERQQQDKEKENDGE